MATWIGFRDLPQDERHKLAVALRAAHFHVEEFPNGIVAVETEDMVAVDWIFKRTCISKARVSAIRVDEEELQKIEHNIDYLEKKQKQRHM